MLKTLLLSLILSAAAVPNRPPNVVQRCTAVWELTVVLPSELYSGGWCEGAVSAVSLSNNGEGSNKLVGMLQAEKDKLRLELARDSAPGQPLWLGLDLVSAITAQPLKSTQAEAVKATLQLTRRDDDAIYLYMDVADQSLDQIMQSITRATGITVRGASLASTKTGLKFAAINVNDAIAILADVSGLQRTFRADDNIDLVRARDGARSVELSEQFRAKAAQGDFDAGTAILGQLRELERLRSAQDLPIRSGLLQDLAHHYELKKDYAQLLALRREQLALALRIDARPRGFELAAARVDLARALQLSKSAGSEDLTLLEQAMPVLQAELADLTDTEQLEEFSQAYTQRGFDNLALQLLERAFSTCAETIGVVSASDWLYECDDTSVALLQRYRKSGDASKAQTLLQSWQRVAIEASDFDSLSLVLRTKSLALRGQWQQVLELSDIALARMPPLATSTSATALDWSNLAMRAQLANGQYARAARSFARNRALLARTLAKDSPLLIEREREQAVLDVLAQGEPLEVGWWTGGDQLSASQLPPLSNAKDAEYQLGGLRTLVFTLEKWLESESKRRAQGSLAMATVAECAALLAIYFEAHIDAPYSAQKFETAQAWRKNAGQSADELAQRAAWFNIKKKAVLALL